MRFFALVIVALAAGCLSQPYDPDAGLDGARPIDLAGRDLAGVDLGVGPGVDHAGVDQAVPDLAIVDLAIVDLAHAPDLAVHHDLGVPHDFSMAPHDLAVPHDFSMAPHDLAVPSDFSMAPQDFAAPRDLSTPSDLSTAPPDLSQPQTCQQCLQTCGADTSACLSDSSCVATLECAVMSQCLKQDPGSSGFASCIVTCLVTEGLTFQQQLQVFEELSSLAVCYSSCTTSCGG